MVTAARRQRGSITVDWGLDGLEALGGDADVLVIVDVLRFTTAVCCALERDFTVYPARWNDPSAAHVASTHGATLAGHRERGELSLSPTDLLAAELGGRLVLPSPNGATLAVRARELGHAVVLAGCLRNASAVAQAAARGGGRIALIAAGERWQSGALRPAVEDLLGAGAIIAALAAPTAVVLSVEAAAAQACFLDAGAVLTDTLLGSVSGQELVDRGWADDVQIAAAYDVTTVVPHLVNGAFVPMEH